MPLNPTHEIHHRRFGRNLGVGLLLAAFVALVFALTVVKLTNGDSLEGYDHQIRAEMIPTEEAVAP